MWVRIERHIVGGGRDGMQMRIRTVGMVNNPSRRVARLVCIQGGIVCASIVGSVRIR